MTHCAYKTREIVLDLVPKYVEYLHKNKVDGVYGMRHLFLYSNCIAYVYDYNVLFNFLTLNSWAGDEYKNWEHTLEK